MYNVCTIMYTHIRQRKRVREREWKSGKKKERERERETGRVGERRKERESVRKRDIELNKGDELEVNG